MSVQTVMVWYPIDAAPRDGKQILAYDPVVKLCDVIAWCNTYQRFTSTQMDGEYGPDISEFQADRATFWCAIDYPEEKA